MEYAKQQMKLVNKKLNKAIDRGFTLWYYKGEPRKVDKGNLSAEPL